MPHFNGKMAKPISLKMMNITALMTEILPHKKMPFLTLATSVFGGLVVRKST